MDNLRTLISCMLGPRLYSFYKLRGHTISNPTPEVLSRSHQYRRTTIESISDFLINASKIMTNFGVYLSPVIFTYFVYKRNVPGSYANSLDHNVLLRLLTTTISILISAYGIRGIVRYMNPEYLAFLKVLEDAHSKPSVASKRVLIHFDVDFSAFPVDFRWSEARDQRPPSPYENTYPAQQKVTSLLLDNFPLKFPLALIISGFMKVVGRRMIYPGSLTFLQTLMDPAIRAGRARLIEEFGGIRNKLESYDGNFVDSMFIDRRGTSPNGDYLVIGCEGNGGFYELGSILTPLEAGYSVLGWNHPGFGGSTGIPYPDQDIASVDTVIKFAMDKLNFSPSQIVIYGWSIGGFTATWAGMRNPDVHGLVIDASFDHILPLARNIFPGFMYPIVEFAIRKHFDLDNSRHLNNYSGPILLIRRSQDEVITSDPYNSPPHNRANYLLINLLTKRFPDLMDSQAVRLLTEYLAGNARYQEGFLRRYSVDQSKCLRLLYNYLNTNSKSFPVNIGPGLDNTARDELVLFLASKYMIDYDAVHCAPLPPSYFQRPWNLLGLAANSSNPVANLSNL